MAKKPLPPIGSWWWTLAIVLAGCVVHLWALRAWPDPMNADSPRYVELGESLLRDGTFRARELTANAVPGGVLRVGPPVPETIRTPGYPVILAALLACGASPHGVVLVQHALLIALGAFIHRRRFGSLGCKGAGAAVTGLLIAASPQAAMTASQLLSESWAAAVLTIAAMLLVDALHRRSPARAAASGLAIGVATLLRPLVQYLPFVFAILLLARRPTRKLAVPFLIAALLLPGAWAWRNYRATGVFTVASIDGESLLLYRALGAVVVSTKSPLDAIFALQKESGFYAPKLRLHIPYVREALRGHVTANHAQRSQLFKRLALRKLREHPFAFAAIATSGVIELLFDDLPLLAAQHVGGITMARLTLGPLSAGFLLLAILGCRALLRRDRTLGILLVTALVYFVAVSAGPESESRFLVTFLPLYTAAIGMGLESLLPREA